MRDVGTLLEALPYMREFSGRTVVIKYGGAAMNDPELREEFARDVVLLRGIAPNMRWRQVCAELLAAGTDTPYSVPRSS